MSVLVEREDRIGIITLDRAPVNAFDEAQTALLAAAVADLGADPEIGCVLVRGAGRHFCGGADIAMMNSWREAPDRRERMVRFAGGLQNAFAALAALPKPTVAAVSGAATGGGLELALACDFRLATGSAHLGLPEVGLGLLPGAGGTQRLTHAVGPAVATRLILGAEIVDGHEAHRLGIVHTVVDGDLAAEALTLARRLAGLPAAAYGAAKRCIAAARGQDGYTVEIDEIGRLMEEAETTERLERFLAGAK